MVNENYIINYYHKKNKEYNNIKDFKIDFSMYKKNQVKFGNSKKVKL